MGFLGVQRRGVALLTGKHAEASSTGDETKVKCPWALRKEQRGPREVRSDAMEKNCHKACRSEKVKGSHRPLKVWGRSGK